MAQGVALGGITAFFSHCKKLQEENLTTVSTELKSLNELWKEHCEKNSSNPLCDTCLSSGTNQVDQNNAQCLTAPHLSFSNEENNSDDKGQRSWESDYGIPEPTESQSLASTDGEVPHSFIPIPTAKAPGGSGQAGSRGGGGGGGGIDGGGSGSNAAKSKKEGKGNAKKKGYDTDILGGTRSGGGGYNFASVPTSSGNSRGRREFKSSSSPSKRKRFSLKDFLPKKAKEKKNKKSLPAFYAPKSKKSTFLGRRTNNIFFTHSRRIALLCKQRQLRCPLRNN